MAKPFFRADDIHICFQNVAAACVFITINMVHVQSDIYTCAQLQRS